MATTTATVTLSSSDLTGDALSLSASTTLTKADSVTGLDQTTGVARKIYTQNTADVLIDESLYADDKAHKLYLRNPSTVSTEYFLISVGNGAADTEIGRLYAGDWMFIPYSADTNVDVVITPSVATTMTLEYMLIHE